MPFDIDNEMVFRCPLKLITQESWEYIEAYKFYKMGLLPNGSIYTHESRKYLDAMTILDNEFSRREQEQLKKANKNGRK